MNNYLIIYSYTKAVMYIWYRILLHIGIRNVYSFLSATRITAKKIGDIPCRRFLPKLTPGLEYYTLKDESVQPINKR